MIIYLDAVWLLNILLDWMILLLTKHMSKVSTKHWTIFVAALVASLFVPITIFYPTSILLHPIGKLAMSILIIVIGFGIKHIKITLRLLFTFYFVTFALGGSLTAIHFFLSSPAQLAPTGIVTWSSGLGDPISWSFVIIGFPVVWIFTKNRLDKHTLTQFEAEQIMRVSFHYNNTVISTTGYVDSGNQLIDPFTKKYIVVCDYSIIKQLFSEEQIKEMKKAQASYQFEKLGAYFTKPIDIVPYHGVSGEPQFMLAFKPEKFTIYYEKQKILVSNVIVGLQFSQLATDGSYHCLLHPALFNQTTLQLA
ncbi:sigma-E processing peptidase SpoIIGA [Paraliobacillus sp. JSM ZJ581]|uniref:sigma-E processing peptidase SpoIIGA n=1 Tax=Paraliobacillus sp. JSM ZJ581 TaxID=3342118 RepID=UPI0035A8CBE4